jgi:DNA-binding NarL/FixJ family response regulator
LSARPILIVLHQPRPDAAPGAEVIQCLMSETPTTGALRVLLVEDDVLLGTLLQELLAGQPEVRFLGIATTAQQALEKVEECRPDLVLLDIGLPDRSGLDVVADLTEHYPEIRVLMLTLADDMESVLAAFRSGALGYIPKRSAMQSLGPALQAIRRGQAWIDPEMSLAVLRELRSLSVRVASLSGPRDPLTDRERQVATLVSQGRSDDEIAAELGLSPHTVRVHIKRIRHKLKLPNRAALAAYMARDLR